MRFFLVYVSQFISQAGDKMGIKNLKKTKYYLIIHFVYIYYMLPSFNHLFSYETYWGCKKKNQQGEMGC